MIFIASILGAIWRRIDGDGGLFRGWHLLPLLFIAASYFYNPMLAISLAIAWVSLLDGFHEWTDFGYMSMRYTGYAALACALAGTSNWYIVVGFVCGMSYPIGNWLIEKGYKYKYTEIAEYICGAGMFGGAVLFTV